ncbi:hypothetical protein Patl1_02964 [Pistacia atlantica]|uniref:Uncharacterized protein n=1 Tax=Pistacia atlantica TaxID=434234 RepID=A0ACC1C8J7_9ROSI|nr:hypothetical protein Patl1_02964 [Pistacia atlantica]
MGNYQNFTVAMVAYVSKFKIHKCNFVLHISPMTFLGCGLSGPLSRCPEVKYNHPSQKPVKVVFTRYGSFPITDHVCN